MLRIQHQAGRSRLSEKTWWIVPLAKVDGEIGRICWPSMGEDYECNKKTAGQNDRLLLWIAFMAIPL